ncbi:hypothetical protein Pst134EA_022368 [Puccinia striiformis f. sp. tritici]|uniref:hypothetical protein n=1 Tax=Puccinia striiformis f. sp. tritici TaxID=168172 RepID=UPI0020077B77|nr:hypothetical protein Pst134EA_022368 [Puccinia striiformis f. sp. tritici]KAH9454875.1 hypothetical protein Pst134EA_022368 [Puccinia striiformis f. sp. tritici]
MMMVSIELVCYQHHKELLKTNQETQTIRSRTSSLEDLNQELISKISATTTSRVAEKLQEIITKRNKEKLSISHLESLSTLIELPQLINQNSSLLEPALKLKLRTTNNRLTQTIDHQVNRALHSQRDQLIHQLAKPELNLQATIRIIHLLKKFVNQELLGFIYLASRFKVLIHSLELIQPIKRWIEVWRAFVGDTISIYQHIFPAEDNHLNYFLTEAIHLQSHHLTNQIQSINSTSILNSLLIQLTYCGNAFGKHGIDFTLTHLSPLFISRTESIIRNGFQIGVQNFRNDLQPFIISSLTKRRSSSSSSIITGSLVSSSSEADLPKPSELLKQSPNDQDLRTELISLFPILVRFINTHLSTLNELRLIPISGSYSIISEYQCNGFEEIHQELSKLVQIYKDTTTTVNDDDSGIRKFKEGVFVFIYLWAYNILPVLERSLRVDIYQDLNISQPSSRFIDLVKKSKGLLGSIFPDLAESCAGQIDSTHDQNLMVEDVIDDGKMEINIETEIETEKEEKSLDVVSHTRQQNQNEKEVEEEKVEGEKEEVKGSDPTTIPQQQDDQEKEGSSLPEENPHTHQEDQLKSNKQDPISPTRQHNRMMKEEEAKEAKEKEKVKVQKKGTEEREEVVKVIEAKEEVKAVEEEEVKETKEEVKEERKTKEKDKEEKEEKETKEEKEKEKEKEKEEKEEKETKEKEKEEKEKETKEDQITIPHHQDDQGKEVPLPEDNNHPTQVKEEVNQDHSKATNQDLVSPTRQQQKKKKKKKSTNKATRNQDPGSTSSATPLEPTV